MLQHRSIQPHTLELLRQIQDLPCARDTRLVGGTALALQYGHRLSVDLDFFGRIPEDALTMQEELETLGELKVIKESTKIRIYQLDGIKIDFVDYSRYPWLSDSVIEEGIKLAAPCDIAAMKVNAIEGRGTKKDFIDIYVLLQHYSLNEILEFYKAKYPEHSILRALMSLTYFDDADLQMPPPMFNLPDWDEIKRYIKEIVAEYSR